MEYLHSRKVRRSDPRLDQWLVDSELNVHLSGFNATGFDHHPALGLTGRPAQGLESPTHYLPRDSGADSTVQSDLFALGSTLYELTAGEVPHESLSEEAIESLFRARTFPNTQGLLLRDAITNSWQGRYHSAKSIIAQWKDHVEPPMTQLAEISRTSGEKVS